jgi:hypothetical protein
MVVLILQHNREFGEVGFSSPNFMIARSLGARQTHRVNPPHGRSYRWPIAADRLPVTPDVTFFKTNSITLQATDNPSSCRSHLSASAAQVANPGSVERRLSALAALC